MRENMRENMENPYSGIFRSFFFVLFFLDLFFGDGRNLWTYTPYDIFIAEDGMNNFWWDNDSLEI